MLKRTDFISKDGHPFLKCKTCKQEFYIVHAGSYYAKTVCFCPYCGDFANKTDKLRYRDHDEFEDKNE